MILTEVEKSISRTLFVLACAAWYDYSRDVDMEPEMSPYPDDLGSAGAGQDWMKQVRPGSDPAADRAAREVMEKWAARVSDERQRVAQFATWSALKLAMRGDQGSPEDYGHEIAMVVSGMGCGFDNEWERQDFARFYGINIDLQPWDLECYPK